MRELKKRQQKDREKEIHRREKMLEKEKAEHEAQIRLKVEREAYEMQVCRPILGIYPNLLLLMTSAAIPGPLQSMCIAVPVQQGQIFTNRVTPKNVVVFMGQAARPFYAPHRNVTH